VVRDFNIKVLRKRKEFFTYYPMKGGEVYSGKYEK